MLDAPEALDEPTLLQVRRGLLPADLVAEAVDTLADMLGGRLRGSGSAGDLDSLVDAVRRRDRGLLGAVYDGFRESLIFRRLITAPELSAAAAGMVGARRLHSPFQHAVFRMDLAGEHRRGFGWHQDFPYNVMSASSVTAWTPLTPVGAHNGSIDVAPLRSDRLYPVDIRHKRDEAGRKLATRDAFIVERLLAGFESDAVKLALAPGDVVLFHNRLVHRSGFNPGPRHRYSIQARFGDLLAEDIAARGWRNRSADGFDTFKMLHPDLVESEEP